MDALLRPAHHVQINVHQATSQVLINLDGRGVIAVFPERTLVTFALVEFLRRASRNQLHALRDHPTARILHQQMNVIGRDHVIEHGESETLLGFKHPVQVAAPVPGKLQQKRLAMAAVSDVPDMTGEK